MLNKGGRFSLSGDCPQTSRSRRDCTKKAGQSLIAGFISCNSKAVKPKLLSNAVNSNFSYFSYYGVNGSRVSNFSNFFNGYYGVVSSNFFSVLGFVTAGYHAYTCEYSERKE